MCIYVSWYVCGYGVGIPWGGGGNWIIYNYMILYYIIAIIASVIFNLSLMFQIVSDCFRCCMFAVVIQNRMQGTPEQVKMNSSEGSVQGRSRKKQMLMMQFQNPG